MRLSQLLRITILLAILMPFASSTFADEVKSPSKMNEDKANEKCLDDANKSGSSLSERENCPVENDKFSWQFTLNIGTGYEQNLLKGVKQEDLDDFFASGISVDLYYQGFFLQTNHRRLASWIGGVELGYQLVAEEEWTLDLLSKNYIPAFSPNEIIEDQHEDIPTLDGLSDRDPGIGLALRYSRFMHNDIFTIDLAAVGAFNDAKGWLIESFYSHLILYKNWDIYIGGGITYYSGTAVNYFLGIKDDDISAARPYYQANSGFKALTEIYLLRPLSKNWTFNAGITQNLYSKGISDSPLSGKKATTSILAGVSYVF